MKNDSFLEKYRFREQSDGFMVGGISLNNILMLNDFAQTDGGNKQLEEFSVPPGLYVSGSNGRNLIGGGFGEPKSVIGGTIDDSTFNMLYGKVSKTVTKRAKTQKRKTGY